MVDDDTREVSADEQQLVRGVLIRRTIRGGHATLAIIVTTTDSPVDTDCPRKEERMVLVIIRLGGPNWDGMMEEKRGVYRSNIRRMGKMGDEFEFLGTFDESTQNEASNVDDTQIQSTDWRTWERFVVDYHLPTSSSTRSNVRVCQKSKWNASTCQLVRAKYFVPPPPRKQQQHRKKSSNQMRNNSATKSAQGQIVSDLTQTQEQISENDGEKQSNSRHHGGGIGKRRQGEFIADFLLWMLSTIYNDECQEQEVPSERSAPTNHEMQSTGDTQHQLQKHLFMKRWLPLHPSLASPDKQSAVAARNSMVAKLIKQSRDDDNGIHKQHKIPSGGIIDAAGGAGHVSLALALRGIHSTVVDPRSTAGKLPGRDRKSLRRSKHESFSTYRAWFGSRHAGGGVSVRHECNHTGMDGNSVSADPTFLPICSMCSDDKLLPNCKAIVALHPDEATGDIVDIAVENDIPFVVVPCCVFARLFPERVKPVSEDGPNENSIVSTYYDLIDWLVAKHPAINASQLPFEGANIAVWCATFK